MLLSNQTFTHIVDLFPSGAMETLDFNVVFLNALDHSPPHHVSLVFAKLCCEKGAFYPNVVLFFVLLLFLFFYFVHDSSTELMGAHKIKEDAGTKSEN